MQNDSVKPATVEPPSEAAVRWSAWFGDVDEDIAMNCSTAWSAVCGDDLCYLALDDMKQLAKHGLVEMLPAAPEAWPEAEYGYRMTDKGESLARKYREWLSSPNQAQ